LEEAARQLEISRVVAYKRKRRGPLPYTKGSDGRLYIYLTTNGQTKSGAGKRAEGEVESSNQQQQLSWGSWGFYLLGFYVLWMPVVLQTQDIPTSLFTTSVVLRMVVISYGLGNIWIPTFGIALRCAAILVVL
jgi:hypothetical protein